MADSANYKNPQEIFQAFTKQYNDFLQGFASHQGQEMFKQFNQAWSALTTQWLQDPQKWLETMSHYQQQQMNLWLQLFNQSGEQTEKSIAPIDRRFTAKEWKENPVFDYIKQSYLLTSQWLIKMAETVHLDEENQKKLNFYTKYFVDAMSPSNFAFTNPEVIQQAIETKGQSLIDGLQHLLGDMEKGHISMTDESAFELGKNLAITPGGVVYENELMQLIQYHPTTEKVLDRPLLIVPPCINKYYILDLQPQNSFIKYAVDQGNTVFVISWVNPEKELKDYAWDDYLNLGIFKALEIIKAISSAKKINTASWCIGGTLLASALSVMQKKKNNIVASGTYFTTMLDFSEPGDLGVFIDELQIARRESQLEYSGILSGKDLALTFSMLRANDLIWSYVVNNYLKGQAPTPFDILYWNSDPTNLPAKMYSYYIRNMYIENNLIKPNVLTMCNVAVNLNNIKVPSFFLSTIDDHIAPWKTCFSSTELLGGSIEFVLGASGHIAGVINPPAKNKRNYWLNGEMGKGAEHWLQTAQKQPGSWWSYWNEWLKKQGGEEIPAPQTLGNSQYTIIEPAPGRYVKKRIN
ncbi:MAG: class I poly(R)-hydroxyalkanoic acid synthase [Pseudomonadota bacterium]|nr:class I poly(R)-hydroxyalkanoic acid synthase [Pseudomonadota bacterium]